MDTDSDSESETTRRRFLAGAVGFGIGAAAVGTYAVGEAQAAPTGTFPEATDAPLLKIRADRVRLIGRTTDPTADDGTLWYRSDL